MSKRLSLGSHFLSHKKREDLSELFTSFDKDQDGRLSHKELEAMLLSAGVDNLVVTDMIHDVQKSESTNGDSIGFEEFVQLMRPTLANPYRLTKKQQELKEAFDAFDKDGDGVINVPELKAMMDNLGDKITLAETQALIRDVDLDKDGVVSFEEFCIMMGVEPKHNSSFTIKRSSWIRNKQTKTCEHHHSSSIRKFFCTHKK
ncbi:hypothetical protein BDF20DRAFT_905689 [Mycotypha africana]|uniref:uncharacterized protein n=1 Tax=Mycotypha africana TaxID=64632 RepID=UPI002301BA1C|nr:uncharacterized protein BDF20DRAFT_905689 [Mycotypha africana]KAI8981987.1 hypothetical protein BDF20DRAFT_905689 [Mycotypha africana]